MNLFTFLKNYILLTRNCQISSDVVVHRQLAEDTVARRTFKFGHNFGREEERVLEA